MHRLASLNALLGLVLGLLPWVASPVHAECNSSIRATTPTADFTLDDATGTATHHKTGLTWMRCALGQRWDAVARTCTGSAFYYTWGAALRAARDFNLVGNGDWRVPNIKELDSIVEVRCWSPTLNETVFPGVSSFTTYWSSTPDAGDWYDAGDSYSAWYMDTTWGLVDHWFGSKGSSNQVRLVRGGQSFSDFEGNGTSTQVPQVKLDKLDGQDFRSGATISSNPAVLGNLQSHREMIGAATDGEARLVLRARTTQPGAVTFSIPPGDGQLSDYRGGPGGTSVTVQTVPVNGQEMAFAIYRAPEQFPRTGHNEDKSLGSRQTTLTLQVTGGATLTQTLVLERPPVVLIHGLGGGPESWSQFVSGLNSRISGLHIYTADYRETNFSSFSVNRFVPMSGVAAAKDAYRNQDLAVVQADVFGHSMGGILGRIWAEETNPGYRTDGNYQGGDLNKLITIDTPHKGSWSALPDLVIFLFGETETDADALFDLLPISAALSEMNGTATLVPSHAIVGDGSVAGTVDLANLACRQAPGGVDPMGIGRAYCQTWRLLKFHGYNTTVSYNFSLGGDLIVGAPSQRDGFGTSSTAVSTFRHVHWSAWDGLVGALESDQVMDRSVELLNAAPNSAWFGSGFPVSSADRLMTSSQSLAQPPIRIGAAGTGVQIASPANGSTVAPRQTVTVIVQSDAGLTLAALALVSPGDFQQVSAAPWTFPVTIPEAAVGSFKIAAVGKDSNGTFYTAEVTLNVTSTAALRLLDVTPANVRLTNTGWQQLLVVKGIYQDDAARDLTNSATGTTYQSSNTGVVTVDGDGRITAAGNGTATVTATNSRVSAYVSVRVEAESDLAISQSAAPDPTAPGGRVTYTLTVRNLGMQRALDVQVADTLPIGATLVQAVGTDWVCSASGGGVSCIRDALDAGAAATISLTVNAPLACDVITNQATVNASTRDSDVDNNLSIVTTHCGAPTYALTLTKAGTGSGTVGGGGTYAVGAPVTLTATADTGSTFTGWSPSPCAAGFVMPATDLTCIATFTANRYAVTALAGTNGRISPATQTVNHGATAAFTVTPNTGYLATATGCGGTLSGTTYTTGSITGACTVSAGFARAYPLTLTKTGTGSGRVTGTGIDCGSDCTEAYAGGTSVTFTASPAGSSNFAGWRGACLGTGGCTVTIGAASSAMGVTANFSLKTYPITPTAVPAAGGTVTCTPNPVSHGASSSCIATPKTGYTLTAFSGACTGAACALTNVTEAKGLTASFGLKTYPITATANPVVGGTVTCTPNPVTYGTNSTCTASANVGYTLSAFTGCTRSGTSSQCALTGVTAAKTVIATFSPAKYPITAIPSPLAGGTVTCTPNPVTHGTNSSCTATAKTGYSLGAFSSGCTRIGTTSRCTLTGVTAPTTVTVIFVPNTYSVTATANPVVGGTVTCTPNPVTHGSGATCTAAPNVGYTLSAFTGCTRSGTSSQCALTSVTAAKTVIATFSPARYPITATASPLAGGTVTCTPNPVSHGTSSTCTARPKTGYAFAGFSGACTGASCVLNNVTAAQGVTANFTVLTLRIDDVSRVEGNLGTSAATFTVTLSAVGAGTVTVRYATANVEALAGSDYTAAGGTLAFLPGQTSKTLTVNLRGDTAVESDETFVVNLSAPTGATLLDKQGLGTIRNDD